MLFLTREHYIPFPLEQTYMQVWQGMPAKWQGVITKPTILSQFLRGLFSEIVTASRSRCTIDGQCGLLDG